MSPHSKRTGAVILAAGGSARFGQPKQLISFFGKNLICRIVDAAHEAGCSPVIAVIGRDCEKVRRALRLTNTMIVENETWQSGIGSSVRVGMQGLVNERPSPVCRVDAVVLLACDQPFVDAKTIRGLIALHEDVAKDIVASSYANTLGVPALFSRRFFHALLSLDDGLGAKSIILRNRECVAEFPFAEGAMDIDTRSDYQRLTSSSMDAPQSSSAEKSAERTKETPGDG